MEILPTIKCKNSPSVVQPLLKVIIWIIKITASLEAINCCCDIPSSITTFNEMCLRVGLHYLLFVIIIMFKVSVIIHLNIHRNSYEEHLELFRMLKVLNKSWTAHLRAASLWVISCEKLNTYVLCCFIIYSVRLNAAHLITVQYRDCWCPLAVPVILLAHSLPFRALRHETWCTTSETIRGLSKYQTDDATNCFDYKEDLFTKSSVYNIGYKPSSLLVNASREILHVPRLTARTHGSPTSWRYSMSAR